MAWYDNESELARVATYRKLAAALKSDNSGRLLPRRGSRRGSRNRGTRTRDPHLGTRPT